MSETVAVILAAGVGSRLRPLTDEVPKCLVSLGNETILHRALRVLREDGITRAIVVSGYRDDVVRTALAQTVMPVEVVHNHAYETTQNMLSLTVALRAIPRECNVVKLDGDVVFQRGLVRTLMHTTAASTVAVERSESLGHEEMKVLVERGSVRAFGKGLDPRTAHGESIGIEWFRADKVSLVQAALERAVEQGRTDVYYEDIYNDFLHQLEMHAVTVDSSQWTEIDDVPDLERARALVAQW